MKPAAALTEICGAEAVQSEGIPARLAVAGAPPAVVVTPRDEEQIAAVLKRCSEEGWSVEPCGLGTWLAAGAPPKRVDVLLSTRALDAFEPAAVADGMATASGGTRLDAVANELRATRQYLALDPADVRAGTVGATFATASAGPLRLGYGTPRDYALGLTIVTGDGRILRFGGRVVKNVAGYDVVRLIVGSRGTLGVITEVHFRLRPYPEDDATVLAPVSGAGPAVELAAAARAFEPVALEVLSPPLVRRVTGGYGWLVAIRFHGVPDAVTEAIANLVEVARRLQPGSAEDAEASSAGEPNIARRLEPRDASGFWGMLRTIEGRAAMMLRMAGSPSALDTTIGSALRIAGGSGAGRGTGKQGMDSWCIAAHAGDGIVRAWTTERPDPRPTVEMASAIEAARADLQSKHGSLIIPVAPPDLPDTLQRFALRSDADPIGKIEAGLRASFDPAGVMAPGRFVLQSAA